MSGTAIVQEVVSILVAGIQGMGTGIGQGVSSFVTSLAFTGTGNDQTLSIYFIMILVFGGVALAVALTTRVFLWLTHLGK